MAIYGEAGMIGVVGAMFVYLVISLSNKSAKQQETLENLKVENKGQSETLENMEGMVIKLIERWNKADERLDRKFDDLNRNINDLDNQVSEITLMDFDSIDQYRGDVKERLARIESILHRELPDIKDQLKISNGRTRSLENWRNYILGGMAILTTMITYFGGFYGM